MIAILTGDIINSRQGDTQSWLLLLKQVLNTYGKTPQSWQIFRGDSFQLSVVPERALIAAIHLKAAIRQTQMQDVRIGIGIGEESHKAKSITESNGSAFVHSGESFESLKKHTLAIKSNKEDWDAPLNLMLILAMHTANSWSSTVAEVIKMSLEHPDKNQKEIATLLKKSQSSISEALKRGGYDELMEVNTYYQDKLSQL